MRLIIETIICVMIALNLLMCTLLVYLCTLGLLYKTPDNCNKPTIHYPSPTTTPINGIANQVTNPSEEKVTQPPITDLCRFPTECKSIVYKDDEEACAQSCHNITAEGGTLLSPGYPQDYGGNKLCAFRISVCESKKIKIKFIDFSLEKKHDWIYVDYGQTMGIEYRRFTGYGTPNHLVSSANDTIVIFTSDHDNSALPVGYVARWKIEYEVV